MLGTSLAVDASTHRLTLGFMRHVCGYCGARHFLQERTAGTEAQPSFGSCCMHGKVQLNAIPEYPPYWRNLLNKQDAIGRHFRECICKYNMALAFASTGDQGQLCNNLLLLLAWYNAAWLWHLPCATAALQPFVVNHTHLLCVLHGRGLHLLPGH